MNSIYLVKYKLYGNKIDKNKINKENQKKTWSMNNVHLKSSLTNNGMRKANLSNYLREKEKFKEGKRT